MFEVGQFVLTNGGKLGRVEEITGKEPCPIRVRFEKVPGNWDKVEDWGKEGIYNPAEKFNFLCSPLNFYIVSVSVNSIIPRTII